MTKIAHCIGLFALQALQRTSLLEIHPSVESSLVKPPPTSDSRDAWQAYWQAQEGQSWRTEPEIDRQRQKRLDDRRHTIKPDSEQGIYPFAKCKLRRADIAWLLATHRDEYGCGPVDWNDERQRVREGLDLHGANLHGVDLSGLPLACLIIWHLLFHRMESQGIASQKCRASLYTQ